MFSFKKSRDNEKRRQILTRWLASFAVTTVVVVSVVVINQTPVSADFLSLQALGNEIVYRIDVQDPDNRIAENTLQLEITGGTERYYVPLSVGESSGSYSVLRTGVSFDLLISANLGFGQETLDRESVEINGQLSGAILDCYIDPTINLEDEPDTLNYYVDVKYYDPNVEVESSFLEYAVVTSETYPEPQKYNPNELYYESIPLQSSSETILLEYISNYNLQIHLRLVVYLIGQETPIILDEYGFSTPFRFLGSLYPYDVGSEYVVFSVYVENSAGIQMSLWIDLYHQSQLLTSVPVTLNESSEHNEENFVRIEHLMPNTPHSAILRATYLDSETNEEVTSTTQPVTFSTAPMYDWQITSFTETDTTYEVTVSVNDPSNIVSSIMASVITKDSEGYITNYFTYYFTEEIVGPMAIYTGSITKPLDTSYDLEIYLQKSIASSYYEEIIYTLSV